jgi:ABC-type dipeptide/oligopeptide/nickel transport system ATPase component
MDAAKSLLLSVQDLKVYFHSENEIARAVDGISFDVRREETVCIVGESGCGKTVAALSIMGLVPIPPGEIAGGRILFRDINLLDFDDAEMQKIRGNQIAMIFQEPLTSLNPVFTIGDQIGEAIKIHENMPEDEVIKRSQQLLKDVGIDSPADRLSDYPHQLSGGQRQRVMIAMALACDPDLVIADEPTTALDVTVQAQILRLINAIQKRRSMSVLYITHDLGVVSKVADRVCVMYAGIIAEQGSRANIFTGPKHP